MLALPLEQFIFHTFEKAPWTTEVQRERQETADRGRREVEREKTVKGIRRRETEETGQTALQTADGRVSHAG